jgi:hypothetical protein
MNHRKRKQLEKYNYNKTFFPKKSNMYTPEGYMNDPQDSKCPYCGKSGKSCSHIDSLSRAWCRSACASKHKNIRIIEDK